ncbi:MAG: SDR family oxidoreductase [Planctomycetota bacterium]|nr:SDR family oxidoreductase [Planctomycetota bacterium]MDA2988614.1 SDR family oxidoreductase [Actinomycetota bacterium]
MIDLTGRRVIVTGAASGIGRHYAMGLGRAGASVAVLDLADPGDVVAELREAGTDAIGMQCSVTDRASVVAALGAVAEHFGGIDALVNNAALFSAIAPTRFEDIGDSDWDQVLAVNVKGVAICTSAALPYLRRAEGATVVNVASASIFKGVTHLAHYVASKGAVVALTRALARELGPDGITVNCLAPGLTESEGVLANPGYTEGLRAANVASRALARPQTPDDLVGPILFLVSPLGTFMTGQTVVVDGGSVMH